MWTNTDGLPKLFGSVAYLGFDFGGGGRIQISFRKVGPYAYVRGVRGHAPPRKFFKIMQFGAF